MSLPSLSLPPLMVGRSLLGTNTSSAGGFDLGNYLASLSDGFFFDFTKTDRHFQEAVGPTLADDMGEAIGLAMDQRTWRGKTLAEIAAEQPEIFSGGDMSTLTGWTTIANASVSLVGGALRVLSNISGVGARYARKTFSGLTVGRTYRVSVDLVGVGGLNSVSHQVRAQVSNSVDGGTTSDTPVIITPGSISVYFVATETTHTLRLRFDNSGADTTSYVDFDNVSVKLIPGNHGLQASGNLKGIRQSDGCKYDGGDDRHVSPYRAAAGGNFIMTLMKPPVSIPAAQMVGGVQSNSTDRFRMDISPSGNVLMALGNNTGAGAFAYDVRDKEVIAAVSSDGNFGQVFVDDEVGEPFAQSGNPNSTLDFMIGAFNGAGSPANFFGGHIKKIIVGRDHLTRARFQQIRNQLLA